MDFKITVSVENNDLLSLFSITHIQDIVGAKVDEINAKIREFNDLFLQFNAEMEKADQRFNAIFNAEIEKINAIIKENFAKSTIGEPIIINSEIEFAKREPNPFIIMAQDTPKKRGRKPKAQVEHEEQQRKMQVFEELINAKKPSKPKVDDLDISKYKAQIEAGTISTRLPKEKKEND